MSEDWPKQVARARGGDVEAFDFLVRRFQDQAVGYARSLLHQREAAEDAAQEAFVEAFSCLPNLRAPRAFPVFLRRIVRKQADRIRRVRQIATVPLEIAAETRCDSSEPLMRLLHQERAAQIDAALTHLPVRERETALLYYLNEHNLTEIALFLSVPKTTVKNRLHAARQRLRKELWTMAEEMLKQERPSKNTAFADRVVSEIVAEFEQQRHADPHTANRALLEQAREKLDAVLEKPGKLGWETIRAGFTLLWRQNDHKALAALLMRAVTEPRSDSETAWIYLHRTNALASADDPAGAVLSFEAAERWAAGKNPRLAVDWPYDPVGEKDGTTFLQGADEFLLRLLAQSGEFARSWRLIWREPEYHRRAAEAVARVTPRFENRRARFTVFRMGAMLYETTRDKDGALAYIRQMAALADEEHPEEAADAWRALALEHTVSLCRSLGDAPGFDQAAARLSELLVKNSAPWVRGQRHDLAAQYVWSDQHQNALPLLEQNLASGGHANAWGYLLHAAAYFAVTGDRGRTLDLIHECAVREDRDVLPLMQKFPVFATVQDDPEFLAAAARADSP